VIVQPEAAVAEEVAAADLEEEVLQLRSMSPGVISMAAFQKPVTGKTESKPISPLPREHIVGQVP
jgi:hypothetical protein